MGDNQFINISEKFVGSNSVSYNSIYQSKYKNEMIKIGEQIYRLQFENLVILPAHQHTQPIRTINIYENIAEEIHTHERFGGFLRVMSLLKIFQTANIWNNLVSNEALNALTQDIQTHHNIRVEAFKRYGNYGLQNNRKALTPEDTGKIKEVFDNLDSYISFLEQSQKEIKKLKTRFDNLIAPFLFEHITTKPNHYYRSANGVDNNPLYYPAKGFAPLFPSTHISTPSKLFLTELQQMKEKGISILEGLDSVEKRNAKKDLKGYAIYLNLKGAEGFFTHNANITTNILDAKIFETPTQGKTYASRRGYQDCMVVEISFNFSKILEATNCDMGPSMQTLVATREANDLNDLLPSNNNEATTLGNKASVHKKHKI